ncbi:MAG: hypothetical protein L0312_05640 [Acidobacteria bacterium]|nr:hypothetical protein [Acidobacteriota bacterium]
MPRVSAVAPATTLSLDKVYDPALREQLTGLVRQLEHILILLRRDISAVDHQFKDQNDQPTPAEGELVVWRDADATAGNPKAYLVTKQNSVVYTFRSVEVV